MPRGVRNGLVRMQLPWMRDVVVGSVLKSGSGAWRVVREVHRYANGDLRSVTFTIRHCSWTGRCYTILGYTDLRILGYRMVPVRPVRLKGEFNQKIHAAIHQGGGPRSSYILRCCDVEGVA